VDAPGGDQVYALVRTRMFVIDVNIHDAREQMCTHIGVPALYSVIQAPKPCTDETFVRTGGTIILANSRIGSYGRCPMHLVTVK
jgi:hypothetical protein